RSAAAGGHGPGWPRRAVLGAGLFRRRPARREPARGEGLRRALGQRGRPAHRRAGARNLHPRGRGHPPRHHAADAAACRAPPAAGAVRRQAQRCRSLRRPVRRGGHAAIGGGGRAAGHRSVLPHRRHAGAGLSAQGVRARRVRAADRARAPAAGAAGLDQAAACTMTPATRDTRGRGMGRRNRSRRQANALVVLAAGGAIVGALSGGPWIWLHYLCKPLATLLIGALVLRAGRVQSARYRAAVLAGIAFSLAGDVFLMLPQDLFVPGLVAFLLAHLCFFAAFFPGARWTVRLVAIAAYAGVGVANMVPLLPRVPSTLHVPVLAYVLVLVVMAGLAAARAWSL